MTNDETRKTSGSEKRHRSKLLQVRLSDAELAEIAARAESVEMTPASFARFMLLDTPPPRATRKPSVAVQAVGRVLAELGKVGSNVNQIAHALNSGVAVHPAIIDKALRDVSDMRDACLEALNRKP